MGKCINCGIDLQDGILCSECLNKTDDAIAKAEVNLVFTSGTLCMFSNRLEFQTKNAKKDKTILFAEIQDIEITMKNLIGFTYKNEKYDSFAFENVKIAQKWYETLKELIALHQKIVPDEEPEKEPKLIIVQERTKESKLEEVDQELVEERSAEEEKNEKSGRKIGFLGKCIIADIICFILSILFDKGILPDKAGAMSGFFGTIALLGLGLILAVVAGILGVDTTKIYDKAKEERRIRWETRIKLDEARRYHENWKNTKK